MVFDVESSLLSTIPHTTPSPPIPVVIVIRRYHPGEEPAIWEVYFRSTHETNARDYHSELLDRWAPPDRDMDEWRERLAATNPFVAIVEERIAGMAEVDAAGMIDYFYVHPEFLRRGVGTRLMEEIEAQARRENLPALEAEVSLTAKMFFEALGFQVTEARENVILGHPAPNFSMRKKLEESPPGSTRIGP